VTVILVYIIEKEPLETRIVINIIIRIKKRGYRVRVLVDLGIKVNYIKRRLALEISIIVILEVTPLVILDRN